jgi:RimJ/RimL family protein N-acetyltransferase
MLIPATSKNFQFFYNLYMHPQVNPYLLYEMMDEPSFKPIYKDLLYQKVLYKFNNGVADVGMCKLMPEAHRDSHKLYIGGFAVHPMHMGKGYGYAMLQQIIVFATTRNYTRLQLTVSIENENAIALYKKCGFIIEGTLKKFTYLKSENRFVDEYMMCYLQQG